MFVACASLLLARASRPPAALPRAHSLNGIVDYRLELDDDLVPFRSVAFTQHETIR